MPPVCTADPGDSLVFDMVDTEAGRVLSEADVVSLGDVEPGVVSGGNPATGPVAVRGAEPGDVLVVVVESIIVEQRGWVCVFPGVGPMRSRISRERTWFLDVEGNVARRGDLCVPLRPMIGTIGVAPRSGRVGNDYPGGHGGNLDNRYIRAGATVYFPVYRPGGLLAMGDMHAAMGDGELTGSGLEVGGSAKITVDVLHGHPVGGPIVETEDAWYVHGIGPTWDEAAHNACDEAGRLLEEEWGVPTDEVPVYITLAGDLAPCQACQPSPFPVVARLGLAKSGTCPSPFRTGAG
jgi:amidase